MQRPFRLYPVNRVYETSHSNIFPYDISCARMVHSIKKKRSTLYLALSYPRKEVKQFAQQRRPVACL